MMGIAGLAILVNFGPLFQQHKFLIADITTFLTDCDKIWVGWL